MRVVLSIFLENFLQIILPAEEEILFTDQVTQQVEKLILQMKDEVYSKNELMEILQMKHPRNFSYNYLNPAIKQGLVALTIPDKPTSSKQKYYLTENGKEVLLNIKTNKNGKKNTNQKHRRKSLGGSK